MKPPDREHDDRTYDRAKEACAFAGPVPADRLSEVGRNKRAHDPENGCQDKALGLVGAWHDELRDHARNEANDDGPVPCVDPQGQNCPRGSFETFAATVKPCLTKISSRGGDRQRTLNCSRRLLRPNAEAET